MVLMPGNSFSVILNEEDREKCVEESYRILKPGKILIIDVRNFQKIKKDEKNKIKSYPIYNGDNLQNEAIFDQFDSRKVFYLYTKRL